MLAPLFPAPAERPHRLSALHKALCAHFAQTGSETLGASRFPRLPQRRIKASAPRPALTASARQENAASDR
ncbi:MAG: hypothetical protein K8H87_04785 [Pseudorhodoplanes sp.]|nr:hypothetical protein [Pseudorhodoplanes sp.]